MELMEYLFIDKNAAFIFMVFSVFYNIDCVNILYYQILS
jgi:hypothetical protein